jgi:hypothetical protein
MTQQFKLRRLQRRRRLSISFVVNLLSIFTFYNPQHVFSLLQQRYYRNPTIINSVSLDSFHFSTSNSNRVDLTSKLTSCWSDKNRILLLQLNGYKMNDNDNTNNNKIIVNDKDIPTITSNTTDLLNMEERSTTLFGMEKKQLTPANDNQMPLPLFTGILVLIVNLSLTGYGFYVFFTGNDPLFTSQIL